MSRGHEFHPDPDRLRAFALGQLDPAEQEVLEQHVASCSECAARLREVPDDTLLGLARGTAGRPKDEVELQSDVLAELLARWRAGERSAGDELIRRTALRLERMARQMLRGFPVVRASEQTEDVFQGAALRLLTALREARQGNTREVYALAAQHLRYQLIDLARCHRRGNHQPLDQLPAPMAPADEDLERWEQLHQAVEHLPGELREVFSLRFYHGRSWPQVAALLQLSERTARRLWVRAGLILEEKLQGRGPI